MILTCKEVISNGKHFYYVNGRRISRKVYFELYDLKEDIDCVHTLTKGNQIRHYCSLRFNSDFAIRNANRLLNPTK